MSVAACSHCLAEIPDASPDDAAEGGALRFCCEGCRSVHRLLRSEAMEDFYADRPGWVPGPPVPGPSPSPDDYADAVVRRGGASELSFVVSGLRCASCVRLVERYIERQPGVLEAQVAFATGRAAVRFDPLATSPVAILDRVRALGYRPLPPDAASAEAALRRERDDLLIRFGTAAFFAMQIMGHAAGLYAGWFDGIDPGDRAALERIAVALCAPVVFYAGRPFLDGAVAGLRRGAAGMDLLVAAGTLSSFVVSVAGLFTGTGIYADTASMIVTFALLGRLLETGAKGSAAAAVARLLRLYPDTARRVKGDPGNPHCGREEVRPGLLAVGDLVEVLPGERFPADADLLLGETEADESLLTGESSPVPKRPGSRLFAGSVNVGATVLATVAATVEGSLPSRISRAVSEGLSRKPPLQKIADRAAARFVPFVLLLSVATFAGWTAGGKGARDAMLAALSVLAVACPCSMGLATPLVMAVAAGKARSLGIVVRGADAFEKAAAVRQVFLDKTGTLTRGRPRLTAVVPFRESREAALATAAALEAGSPHPFAAAVLREGPAAPPHASDRKVHPGRGVEGIVEGRRCFLGCVEFLASAGVPPGAEARAVAERLSEEGRTVSILADGKGVLAVLAAEDALRPEAPEAAAGLREDGLSVAILSGDHPAAARRAAAAAGIPDVAAGLDPEGKAARVRASREGGVAAMFAGDGVNDAPAMAEAAPGVAVGNGADVALETADVVLLSGDLRLLRRFLRLSRAAMRAARAGLAWSLGYNLVALPLAASGRIHPAAAAVLMAASSLAVVGNAMRLDRIRTGT